MIKYFTIEDLLKHYLQKKFHILIEKKTGAQQEEPRKFLLLTSESPHLMVLPVTLFRFFFITRF